MKTKHRKDQQTRSSSDCPVGRWIFDTLSLRVYIRKSGILAIVYDAGYAPGQQLLWSGIEEQIPALETLHPHGPKLAHELTQAFTGHPITPEVPWNPKCPSWHLELYRTILALPPGTITELPGSIIIEGQYQDRRKIRAALQKCPLAPLVPLHRVSIPGTKPIRFPLGDYWRDYLLRREKSAVQETRIEEGNK